LSDKNKHNLHFTNQNKYPPLTAITSTVITTGIDSNDNSENHDDDSSDNDEDVLEEVLLVDIVCQKHKQSMQSDICILTNAIPPNHFLFLL